MPLMNGFFVPGGGDAIMRPFLAGVMTDGFSFADSATPTPPGAQSVLVQGAGSPTFFTNGLDGAAYVNPYVEELVPWTDFLHHVLPWVKGCPDGVIVDHLIKAARLFCSKTRCWIVRANMGQYIAGKTQYPIPLDENAERARLNGFTVNETRGGAPAPQSLLPLDPAVAAEGPPQCGPTEANTEFPSIDPMRGSETTRRGYQTREVQMDDATHLSINGATPGDRMTVELVLRPSLEAKGLSVRLVSYIDDIAHGAIASLSMLPRQEWTDDRQVAMQAALFNSRIGAVAYNVTKGYRTTGARPRSRFM